MKVHADLMASIVAIALAGGEVRGMPGKAPASKEDSEAINKTRKAYVSAWNAADADGVARLYDEDGWVLYPNQPGILGRPAILAYFRSFFAEFSQEGFQLTSDEIQVTGDWAFDRGSYRWKGVPRAGGAPVEDHGKYLVVLRRQTDGSWKVARDMDNSDRPLAQATREPGSAVGESPALPEQAAAEVREIEAQWAATAVSADVSIIERILADDFLGISPDGVRYTKQDFIAEMKAHPTEFMANHLNDVKVRFFGGVAVAQGDETFTRRGGETARFVWTDVLVRRGGAWQIVAAEDLIAPVGGQPPTKSLFASPRPDKER